MATQDQIDWLIETMRAARVAGHVFPAMAACEAADESAWGSSLLARQGNNLFGCKQHQHPVYDTIAIPTREFIGQKWITEDAEWVKYPDIASCFRDRMLTLRTMSMAYPHYSMALAAETPEEYVTQVSMSWSTDPDRAKSCIAIYEAHKGQLATA